MAREEWYLVGLKLRTRAGYIKEWTDANVHYLPPGLKNKLCTTEVALHASVKQEHKH